MKFFFCIFALIMAYASAASISEPVENSNGVLDDGRIVGGNPTSIKDHPYQISLKIRQLLLPFFPYEHICGGSIYSARFMITAAHCIVKENPSYYQVVAGSSFRNGNGGSSASVQKIIVHENYNEDTNENDIAILVLRTPLPLNDYTMKAIKLAQQVPAEGEMATVTGWGVTSQGGSLSNNLQEVEVPVISNKNCNIDYNGKIGNSMICAGYRGVGGRDSCQADSGGPLVAEGELIGIVSWGYGCATPEYTGVYCNVAYFASWVAAKTSSL